MLSRTALGAVVGTVVGAGFLLTLETLTRYCNGGPGRTGCGAGFPLTVGPVFAFWMIVAAVLIHVGFRVMRAERGWWAAGAGSGLWFLLFLAVIYVRIFRLDMYQEDAHRFMATMYVIVPCVAYALAGALTGFKLSSSRR
ncbi:hypothetical protein SAMN04488564_116107 [Lentzea waywayandensis]|uniref:Uncharacterized protein n=1 Tax=Lentzea waywayandensis TaxID=84724 RepID=A0A1I6FGD1_9PSEU|nr:hypothetical protein [Lentzea waywayandensis]SFR28999.1 hypothetical protein SAMN04488564_116107 [Lentzea waywayandensis]